MYSMPFFQVAKHDLKKYQLVTSEHFYCVEKGINLS